MKIDFQKLGEILNKCVNEKMFIRVGRYEGDYHLGNGQFKKIKGELFIKTNSDTIFRVVSDDSSIFDDFDIIGSDAIVTPINKKIKYEEIDINGKSSLRTWFPKTEEGIKGGTMNIKESEKEEYCISGFYSIVVEAENEEEAIKKVMIMQLNQMDIADVDFVNDMNCRQ